MIIGDKKHRKAPGATWVALPGVSPDADVQALGDGLAPAQVEAGSPDGLIMIHAATCPVTTRRVRKMHRDTHVADITCGIAGKPKTADAAGMATGVPGAGDRSDRVSLASHSPERHRRDGSGRRLRVQRIQDVRTDRNWILRGVYGYVGNAQHHLS